MPSAVDKLCRMARCAGTRAPEVFRIVHSGRHVIWWQWRSLWSRLGTVCSYAPSLGEGIVMPPRTRSTVRLSPALDALVQERIRTSGTPFAVLIQEALSASLAATPPTGTPPPAPTAADSAATRRELQAQLAALTTRVETLEQAPPPLPTKTPTARQQPPPADTPQGHARVAYLSPAHNSNGSLLGHLRGAQQPVIKPRHRCSASRSPLLAGL
jgi:hypothetical protein